MKAKKALGLGVGALLLLSLVNADSEGTKEPYVRVFLSAQQRGSAPGIHDRQKIVDDLWSALVHRGFVVSAGIVFPAPLHLATHDVLVFYGPRTWPQNELTQSAFRSFLLRGGGILLLHHAIEDAGLEHIKQWTGTPWVQGKSRWVSGRFTVLVADPEHDLVKGLRSFSVDDEVAVGLTLSEEDKVLLHVEREPGIKVPVLWVRETDGQRTAFLVLGHRFTTLQQGPVEELIARVLSWAAHRDVARFLTVEERARYLEGVYNKANGQP